MKRLIRQLKEQAAVEAVALVESGMVIGLGEGTTTRFAIEHIAERLARGTLTNVAGIPCSRSVERTAQQLGIPLTTLADSPVIDLTIDGADEVDPQLNLIKGGGGALVREKIVAQATRYEIIIVDDSKLSLALGLALGTRWPVPVAVTRFGWQVQAAYLEDLGASVTLRTESNGTPYVTDDGNLILDCEFGPIGQLGALALEIKKRTGVVEHGIFIGLSKEVIVAAPEGIRHIRKS